MVIVTRTVSKGKKRERKNVLYVIYKTRYDKEKIAIFLPEEERILCRIGCLASPALSCDDIVHDIALNRM
jgi:hypothetical protein